MSVIINEKRIEEIEEEEAFRLLFVFEIVVFPPTITNTIVTLLEISSDNIINTAAVLYCRLKHKTW